MGSLIFADLAAVFIEGDIPHPMDSVFDGPMMAIEGKQLGGVCLLLGEAGNTIDGLGAKGLSVKVGDAAFQAEDLGGIGEVGVAD